MNKADRAKIAERRKAALHKLGLYYGYRGEYLQSITHTQLESLGLLDEQARGSSSPEADLLKRAKSRYERALSLGYISVAERFTQDATFAESVLNEGENEYDCQRYDLLRAAHLPKPSRTKAQMKMGISEQFFDGKLLRTLNGRYKTSVHCMKQPCDTFEFLKRIHVLVDEETIHIQQNPRHFDKLFEVVGVQSTMNPKKVPCHEMMTEVDDTPLLQAEKASRYRSAVGISLPFD